MGTGNSLDLLTDLDQHTAGLSYPDTSSGEILRDVLKPWLKPFGWKWEGRNSEDTGMDVALVSPSSSVGFSGVEIMGAYIWDRNPNLEQISEDTYVGEAPRANHANKIMVKVDSKHRAIDLESGGIY